MSRFIEDKDGDHIQVIAEQEGALFGVTLAATMKDADGDGSTWHTTVGPLDPHALIEAIKAECELHEDDEVHDEEPDALAEPSDERTPVQVQMDDMARTRAVHAIRMNTVRQAIAAVPVTGQRGGIAEAFAGKGGDPQPIEKALKVARFVADGARDIPGVDK